MKNKWNILLVENKAIAKPKSNGEWNYLKAYVYQSKPSKESTQVLFDWNLH